MAIATPTIDVRVNSTRTKVLTQTLVMSGHTIGFIAGGTDEDTYSPHNTGEVPPGVELPPADNPDLPGTSSVLTLNDGTTTITLRTPIFGNTETLDIFRALNVTRNFDYQINRNNAWPVTNVLSFEFEGISEAVALAFLTFIGTNLGKNILLTDHEARSWIGVITNPESNIIVENKGDCNYGIRLEFTGSNFYNPLLNITSGDESIGSDFWSTSARNMMTVGDSYVGNGQAARMYDAFLRTFDHPAGYFGIHATTETNGLADWRQFGGTSYLGGTGRYERDPTNATHGGHFFGLPMCEGIDMEVGTGFTRTGGVEKENFREQTFTGLTEDWFTPGFGSTLMWESFYLYDSTKSVDGILQDGVLIDFSLADSDINAGEAGLNIGPPYVADDPVAFEGTADWESGTKYCTLLGGRLTGGPGNLFAGKLAATSWDSDDHANITNAPCDASNKRYTDAELQRYFELMYIPHDTGTLYVVVIEGPESASFDNYLASCHARNDRFNTIWQAAGGTDVKFIYIGSWKTDLAFDSLTQNKVFWRLGLERNDTYYLGLYGVLGGIIWNGVDPLQEPYAVAHGWDAIPLLGGDLDMSTVDALDTIDLHPVDTDAATFFAWLVREHLAGL